MRRRLQSSISIPADELAPRQARGFVADALERVHRDDLHDDAMLLVSELVSNAVEHGRGPVEVDVAYRHETLHVAVCDHGDGATMLVGASGALAEHGRGLQIVDQISSRWSRELRRRGTRVWFELA